MSTLIIQPVESSSLLIIFVWAYFRCCLQCYLFFFMCWHKTAPLNNCYIYTNTLSQIYKAEDLWMFECSLCMVYSHTQYRIAIHNIHTQYRIAIIAWNPEPSCFALVYFGLQLTPLPICFLISYYSSR